MCHSSTIHSIHCIVYFERIKVVTDFLSQSSDFSRQTSNLNKSASTDSAVKPFSLISNTLEGQDTLRLVLLNNTATQSQHIIAVHLAYSTAAALRYSFI